MPIEIASIDPEYDQQPVDFLCPDSDGAVAYTAECHQWLIRTLQLQDRLWEDVQVDAEPICCKFCKRQTNFLAARFRGKLLIVQGRGESIDDVVLEWPPMVTKGKSFIIKCPNPNCKKEFRWFAPRK